MMLVDDLDIVESPTGHELVPGWVLDEPTRVILPGELDELCEECRDNEQ